MPYPKKPEPRLEDIVTPIGTLKQQRDRDRQPRVYQSFGKSPDTIGVEKKPGKFWSNVLAILFLLFLAWGFTTNWGNDSPPTPVTHGDR